MTIESTNLDQKYNTSIERPGKLVGVMGKKYTRRLMEKTHDDNINSNEINDSENK